MSSVVPVPIKFSAFFDPVYERVRSPVGAPAYGMRKSGRLIGLIAASRSRHTTTFRRSCSSVCPSLGRLFAIVRIVPGIPTYVNVYVYNEAVCVYIVFIYEDQFVNHRHDTGLCANVRSTHFVRQRPRTGPQLKLFNFFGVDDDVEDVSLSDRSDF